MNDKHAYLILAHNDFYVLEKELLLLDDKRNDIYIHIDKKVKHFDFTYFNNLTKYSNITYVKRRNIQWASYRLIESEMELFQTAFQSGNYRYYHLLSGADLPLKTQDKIHAFFQENDGLEFITSVSDEQLVFYKREERFSLYHLFNNIGLNKRVIRHINEIVLYLEKKLRINRYQKRFEYGFGSEWASLSHYAVSILIKNKKWIRQHFKYTHCCDEIYKQTIFKINQFNNIYLGMPNSNMRFILWDEGDCTPHPHTFTMKDYEMLMNSCYLFARKFSTKTDQKIIDKIYSELKN